MDKENDDYSSMSYDFNKRMMFVSVIIIFFACFFIVLFHWYATCFRDRQSRRILHAVTAVIGPKGLPVRVLNSLPTFNYNPKDREFPMECAVCLSEFEENEMGRVLPECKHSFHVDCIDMWLHSHRDCPLCRTEVKAVKNTVELIEKTQEVAISIPEPVDAGLGTSSGLDPTGRNDETRMTCCSSSSPTSAVEVPTVAQLPGPIGHDPSQSESNGNSNVEIGQDIESGLKPISSVRVLKRLFSM